LLVEQTKRKSGPRPVRKDQFAAVILPFDKWLTFMVGMPEQAKAVLEVIEEQVLAQANHDHGPAETAVCDVDGESLMLTVTCKQCGELLWSCSVAYPPPQSMGEEAQA
jgi:hypothetical protein